MIRKKSYNFTIISTILIMAAIFLLFSKQYKYKKNIYQKNSVGKLQYYLEMKIICYWI